MIYVHRELGEGGSMRRILPSLRRFHGVRKCLEPSFLSGLQYPQVVKLRIMARIVGQRHVDVSSVYCITWSSGGWSLARGLGRRERAVSPGGCDERGETAGKGPSFGRFVCLLPSPPPHVRLFHQRLSSHLFSKLIL